MPRRLLNSGLSAHGPRRYSRPKTTPEPTPEPEETTSQVPEDLTKVEDLLEWVGDDPERAQAVLDQENERANPRKTLVGPLTDLILEG